MAPATFEQMMLIAHTRWDLTLEARKIVAQLRRENVEVTSELLLYRLITAVANASPRSRLVAWGLSDAIVEKIAARVANAEAA
jgi:hypothetical protein